MIDLEKHGLRVKPLEWEDEFGNGSVSPMFRRYFAETPLAVYWSNATGWWVNDAPHRKADAPKAAAQADYEARIIAALEIVRPIRAEETT